MTVYICRKERFSAAHRLYVPSWTDEENLAAFGPCANPNGHGHNFTLVVTVAGTPDPLTGLVMDLKDLARIVKEKIVEKVDHAHLNRDVDFLSGKPTSCESLVVEFWKQIAEDVRGYGARLHCIELHETEKNSVRYYGEGVEA